MNVLLKTVWFNKNGEKDGTTPKVSIPSGWLFDMGVTEEEPYLDVELTDDNEIILRKHERRCTNEVQ